MQRHLNAGLFRHRHNLLDEMAIVLPNPLCRHLAGPGRCGGHFLEVELGNQRAAATAHTHVAAKPANLCHEVVAEQGNPQFPHVVQHPAKPSDVLLAPVQAQLDAAHVELVAFQAVNLQARRAELALYLAQRVDVPWWVQAGALGLGIDDGVADTHLPGQLPEHMRTRRQIFGNNHGHNPTKLLVTNREARPRRYSSVTCQNR